MSPDPARKSGFYWIRFEGQVIVAEYTRDGFGCCSREWPHWHVPLPDECFLDGDVCELLSEKLFPSVDALTGTADDAISPGIIIVLRDRITEGMPVGSLIPVGFDPGTRPVQNIDEKTWRCFHCDEVFTSREDAWLHFQEIIYSF